jgi:hypothetical protein
MRNIFGEVLKSSSNFSIARAVSGIIIAFVVLAALGLIFVWPETYVYEVKLIDTRPSPPSTFQPPENVYNERRQSLELVKERSDAKSIERKNPGYKWTVIWARTSVPKTNNPKSKTYASEDFAYVTNLQLSRQHDYIVCYCTLKGSGRRWEVRLDSQKVYYVTE